MLRRGIETMVSDHGLGTGQTMGRVGVDKSLLIVGRMWFGRGWDVVVLGGHEQ